MPLIDRLREAGYLDSSSEDEDPKATKGGQKGESKGKGKGDGKAKSMADSATDEALTVSFKQSATSTEASDDGDDKNEDEGSNSTGSGTDSTNKDTSDDAIKAEQTESETKEETQEAESERESKAEETTGTADTTPETTRPSSPYSDYPHYQLSDHDDGYGSGESDMSEIQIRNHEKVRRVVNNSHGYFNVLGRADCLQQRSAGTIPPPHKYCEKVTVNRFGQVVRERRKKKSQPEDESEYRIVELTYPTGDDNAAEGFSIWGFKNGIRVYRLESEFLPRLYAQKVKTCVGFDYIDISAVCPPKVVTVSAEESAAKAKLLSVTNSATETLTDTPVDMFVDSTATSATNSDTPIDKPIDISTNRPSDNDASMSSSLQPTLEVNDTFAIRPSALGGLGCFALRDLYRGDHVLVERPLIRTNLLYLFHELECLSPEGRAQFEALHAWHPDPNASRAEQIWTANTFIAGELEGLFVVASRFNHACSGSPKQNIGYRYDRHQNVLVLTATARILAGTELLISYGKSRQMLQDRFGFECECGSCQMGGESTKLLTAEELYRRMWS
ncbi:hypothetical protein SBRCBS47491_002591 [Sporothrix bragantina]|uniref:SET domain-containing protein n=1 Tax=Sporothrix bragantina TaxID=671064 RepID=A0ABP0B852_9PEZI